MTENITVVGNVASEPRQATSGAGAIYTSFRLATDNRRFDRATGEWVDGTPNWFTIYVWRALGENALASVRTGDRVLISGRLRLRAWTDGDRRGTAAEIDADAMGPDLRWGTTTFHRARRLVATDPDAGIDVPPAPLALTDTEAPPVDAQDEPAAATQTEQWASAATPF
ncbi:MAG: single-stranded DNA-binding protein [Microbacterium sp.]|jgi:single-strand DNA-binding protein|nr:single-stranded DNA-binding protein [Microbacterium sp.]